MVALNSRSVMDSVNISKYVQLWLALSDERRLNSMSIQIQKITDEYIEISIDAKLLQLAIPANFYTSCSSNGIISNTYCAFVVTLAKENLDESNTYCAFVVTLAKENLDESSSMDTHLKNLMAALNVRLDRLSSRGSYSFRSVLDSIVDTFDKYKSSNDYDNVSYRLSITDFAQNKGSLKNGYFEQLIEQANKICDAARSRKTENRKDEILRWCKVYSPSHNVCSCTVGFEIELTGILSDYYRQRHGHVFEALGFSFATPLRIEVTFQPLGCFKTRSLESQRKSLGQAFRRVLVIHGDVEFKISLIEGNFVYDDGDLDEHIAKIIDGSKANPMHLYGLRYLLPRMATDFFTQLGERDPNNKNNLKKNNVLLACEDNIFVRFLLFIGNRLASLLKQCIICNKELLFTVSRPCSCADKLCMFRFDLRGLGAQVLQEVTRMPLELIDFEIFLAMAAAESFRDVFEPFPPFLLEERKVPQFEGHLLNIRLGPRPHPISRRETKNETKNMDVMRSIIKSFPAVSKMRLCADELDLKADLAKSWLSTPEGMSFGDKYSSWQLPYNVLQFILSTNILSLVFLSENDDKLLKVNNSDSQIYQFAVVQHSPEREPDREFWKSKEQASTFGFHGSNAENWYSILRNGLRCLSNTSLMTYGSTMGKGIYFANEYGKSLHYSPGYCSNWQNGMYNGSLSVVSICEVFSPSIIKNEESDIFMVPQECDCEKSVAVRYLLVCGDAGRSLLTANILHGHTLSYDGQNVNLAHHYQRIRQKYIADPSSFLKKLC